MMTPTPAPAAAKGDNGARTVALVGDFIQTQLASHRKTWSSQHSTPPPPLLVGVQGPQGCGASLGPHAGPCSSSLTPRTCAGKSHLTSLLPPYLAKSAHAISTASLSLDDLYLPHAGLAALAAAHPTNTLVHGRGQPGTHDVALGASVLSALRHGAPVALPVFDKSLFSGQGDRSALVVPVPERVDVVIFEGWMMGFGPLASGEIEKRWSDPAFADRLDYDLPFLKQHSVEDLEFVNQELAKYEALWKGIGCFVMLRPESMEYVWQWRLEVRLSLRHLMLPSCGLGC